MDEPWLTKREVAQKLQISPRTVTRLKLPHTRVGGQNRYRMREVEGALPKDLQGKEPPKTIPVATDLIEVLLTLSPAQYDQMGADLHVIRQRRDSSVRLSSAMPAYPSNTEIILGAVRTLAQAAG